MTDSIRTDRVRTLRRHLATAEARDRVAHALYESLIDGLEFGPRGIASPGDREWIRGALAVWLQDATDFTLEVLAWHVAQALEAAPNDLGRRYDRSHDWEELGWE